MEDNNNNSRDMQKMPADPNLTLDIRNDEIEALIVKYSKENKAENLNELLNKVHVSRVLVPANLNAEAQPVPFLIKNKDGESYMPIYTSKEHIPLEPKVPAILNIPYIGVNDMALKEEVGAAGIVINPFTHNLVFKKTLIEKIDAVEKARKQGTPPKTIKLTEQQYVLLERKQFEKVFLPEKFFEGKGEFIEKISAEKEELIDQLYEESYQQKRLYPYLPEDFSVMIMNISEKLTIVRIDFQTKDLEIGSCIRAYLSWNKDNEETRYFSIELASEKDRILCEIDKERNHINYGQAPVEGSELQKILDMIN